MADAAVRVVVVVAAAAAAIDAAEVERTGGAEGLLAMAGLADALHSALSTLRTLHAPLLQHVYTGSAAVEPERRT